MALLSLSCVHILFLIGLQCTKIDRQILRKISKIVATRCQILRLKCTKFDFGWPTSKGRGGKRERVGRKGEGKGEDGRGRVGDHTYRKKHK